MKGIDQRIAELPPEKLALLLEQLGRLQAGRPAGPERPRIVARRRGADPRPLSFAQERLWFIEQLHPGSGDYNVPAALRLRGALNLPALAQALREVVRRHEVLRSSFHAADGTPIQTMEENPLWGLARVDLGGLPADERETESRRLGGSDAAKPFDLNRAPLLRVHCLQLERRHAVLLFTMHHIACDGWSMQILVREIAALYRAFSEGLPSPLPELKVQYADFAEWQREWLRGERLDRLIDYWDHQLRGARATVDLREGRPAPGAAAGGREELVLIPAETTLRLKALAREEAATSFMLLTALLGLLLHAWSGQEDLCIGANVANRDNLDAEELIGFFVNQLVLRLRIQAGDSFRELLHQVRDVTSEAFAHRDLPFEKLVELLCPERNLSRTPLFQVKVELKEAEDSPPGLPGIQLEGVQALPVPLHCDLALNAEDTPRGLECALTFDAARLRAATAKRMARTLAGIAEKIAAAPQVRLRELAEQVSAESAGERAAALDRIDDLGAARLKNARRRQL